MHRLSLIAILFGSSLSFAQPPIVDQWQYTLKKPADDWTKPDFDDSQWKKGEGGFGTAGTPEARIGTVWKSNDIWLRKTFALKELPKKPALLMHHDEDAEVFINGDLVSAPEGWSTKYEVVPLAADKANSLKVGENVLAVHCFQESGGQFIDVHLIDADKVPELPPTKMMSEPFKSELITEWGAKVTPENAWTDYPRPQMMRKVWQNLNGTWEYAITPKTQTKAPTKWDGTITVPFCLESKLGGVQKLLQPNQALWYRRTFNAVPKKDVRSMLNFEAVDYQSKVFVNGKSIGEHIGGNTPFSVDATQQLVAGENELIVRVEDTTGGYQLRGKQFLNPQGIWYTRVSGIWQTVWLEEVPMRYIEDLHISTDAAKGTITVKVDLEGPQMFGEKLQIQVKDGLNIVTTANSQPVGDIGNEIVLTVPNAKLWSPKSPKLYDLDITFMNAVNVVDQVQAYAGIRTVGKTRDADGNLRFTLNGEVIFHWGPLDQGWWPDGLLTPPSDEAMAWDIQFLKDAGFNMIRKHIKVEPRRYYYHCDKIGMMVWQDQVSAQANPPWTHLKPDPVDADWPENAHKQYMAEFEVMIDDLENHPSIVVWVPFNEAWGQHQTVEVGKWAVKRDPSRLVNIASGGNFWPVGDVVDQHSYPNPSFPLDRKDYKDYIKVVGEFGGHGYPVPGHLWDADRDNWGYGGLPKTKEEYKERYIKSLQILNDLRKQGIAGGVYTQTTDVEGEINGIVTYDRKVIKIPAAELRGLHEILK